jgi:hypothetical protein
MASNNPRSQAWYFIDEAAFIERPQLIEAYSATRISAALSYNRA